MAHANKLSFLVSASTINITTPPSLGNEPRSTPFLFYGYPMERILSPEAFNMILSVALITAECLCLLGVVTNIINIIVFVKLGLRETTSISMMSLAVSDLLLCLLGVWSILLYIPAFRHADNYFRTEDVFILTGGINRYFLARTNALITAYITLERCLCVLFPLKIKSLITRRRTGIVMVTLFAITLGPSFYVFHNYRFHRRFYPDVNKTLLGVAYVDTVANNILDRVIILVCATMYVFVAFVVTSVCTIYLIIHLTRASAWRLGHSNATTTTSEGVDSSSSSAIVGKERKDRKKEKTDKVARTVVAIAVVFILCFFPGFVGMTLYIVLPGYTLYGKYGQIFQLVQSLGLFFETVNSSINMFIYSYMGSSFRAMLQRVLGLKRE